MPIGRDDEMFWTIKDMDSSHMLSTEEYYNIREQAVVQFVKESKSLTSEQSVALYGYGINKIFRVVDIERDHRIRVDRQAFAAWMMTKGNNIVKSNSLQKMMLKIAADKDKRLKDNAQIEIIHQTLKGYKIDRTGIRPTVTLPKTGHKLDIFTLYHVNRIESDNGGWFRVFGKCWGDEVQTELAEVLAPMLK